MKNLKIRTKLTLLGIILLLSFSAVIYTVNADNDRIHDLNDSARVSYSTRALSTKWRIARQELVNAYFVAAMANETGALSAEMRAAIGERAVDLDDVFERLAGKGADRLVTASVWAGAQTNGKRLAALVRDEFPALADQRVGREGVGDLSGRIMAESEKLAEAQTVVDDALKEQFGTLAQTVNDELASANTRLMLIATPMAVLMLAAMVVIALGITRPLRATVMDIRKLADGDLDQKLSGLTRRDEIGDVVQALLDLQAATARRADAAMEHDRQAQAAMEAEKQATMRDFAEGFEASVGNIVETVISGARKARESSEKVRTMSDETTERSAAVAASA